MAIELSTNGRTEGDLEARANAALQEAIPWLDRGDISHQLTFSFKLGHSDVVIDGGKASHRRGRVDMLIERAGERIAIVELKRPGLALTDDDRDQGLSYARARRSSSSRTGPTPGHTPHTPANCSPTRAIATPRRSRGS